MYADSLFTDLRNCDFHLKSVAGQGNPRGKERVSDAALSPASTQGAGRGFSKEQEPKGGRINMGGLGNTP